MNEYKGNNKKKYYPSKRNNNYPQKHHINNKPANHLQGFFNGTYGEGMNFNTSNKDMSAYVVKTIYIRDQYGNVQRAKQKFFLNSGKQLGHVHVHDDESNF